MLPDLASRINTKIIEIKSEYDPIPFLLETSLIGGT